MIHTCSKHFYGMIALECENKCLLCRRQKLKCHFLQFNMLTITHNSHRFILKTFHSSFLCSIRSALIQADKSMGDTIMSEMSTIIFIPKRIPAWMPNTRSRSKRMHHSLGIWNGEMVSFSSASVGLSSGTFPFSISTLPSITCVSTPLAAWTNFWRFQKTDTKSKST